MTRSAGDIAGIAVHMAARVCALAAPGEVLVTRTVRDLVAGSGIVFEDRGEHELKGVPTAGRSTPRPADAAQRIALTSSTCATWSRCVIHTTQ